MEWRANPARPRRQHTTRPPREGDAAAFGELVLRHQSAVYRAALAAVGVPSDADDVAQEAFLLAYTRLRSFRGAASFKTWLLTIAWNQAINRRRANTRWWRRILPQEPSLFRF